MKEQDNSLEQLFARHEPDTETDGEAFVTLVHQRVMKQHWTTRALELGMYTALAVASGTIVAVAPEVLVYPVQLLHELLSSPPGAGAAALGAIGLAWLSRFEDA
jgi:hypothetical protein